MKGAIGPRIVIAGAGAIGCHVGLQLHCAGAAVALLGSERVAADVAAHGLRVDSGGLDGPQFAPEVVPWSVSRRYPRPGCLA